MTSRAVLFDLDDTLWYESAPVDWEQITRLQSERMRPEFERLGISFDCSDFVRTFWREFAATFPDPDRLDGVFEERRWLDGPLHLRSAVEALGVECARGDASGLWEALHAVPLRAFNTRPFGDAASTIDALVATGQRLGIVTSRPLSASIVRRELLEQGFADAFEALVVAGEMGYRKPHESVFSAALDQFGLPASEVVMVGDLYEQDIVPAAKLGMITVLKLNERMRDDGHVLADHQIHALSELLKLPMFASPPPHGVPRS